MNKRVVSILLVLIMVISNCTVVFGADKVTGTSTNGSDWGYGKATGSDGTTTTNSKDVNANFTALSSSAVYSVDITWGSLEFTYTGTGTWDAANHHFKGFSDDAWNPVGGGNIISFKNHSSVRVSAGCEFSQNEAFVTGTLTGTFANEISGSVVTLESLALGASETETEGSLALTITGTPETVKATRGKIGSVTVNLFLGEG